MVCRCRFLGGSLFLSPLPSVLCGSVRDWHLLSSGSGFLEGLGALGGQGDPGSLVHP